MLSRGWLGKDLSEKGHLTLQPVCIKQKARQLKESLPILPLTEPLMAEGNVP